jgi:HEPN domain-containing protein/predicted nucleotidyltransferase
MIQSAIESDASLQGMIKAIVERVHPSRIVLYGSRARGDARPDSDYDLMVEVEYDDGYTGYRASRHRIDDAIGRPRDFDVDIVVRKPGELEFERDDPGRMDWDIAREGIIVYPPDADSNVLRPLPRTSDRVSEGDEPPRSMRDWLDRAGEDLLMIEKGLSGDPVPWGAVCFHAQQAAEKYLKALHIRRGIRPSRTHDLAELVSRLRAAGYELPELSSACEALEDYAVDVRYPNNLLPIPDEPTGRAVLEAGRRIVDAARPYL